MEDVKMPDPAQLSSVPASEPASIPTLDGWIESLMNCKQLAESDVQRLCDKVCDRCRAIGVVPGLADRCTTLGSGGPPGRVQRTASGMCPVTVVAVVADKVVEMPCYGVW